MASEPVASYEGQVEGRPRVETGPPDLAVEHRDEGGAQQRDEQGGDEGGGDGSTRERILVAASELFARRGYYGTSTRAMAEVVGIRQPSMFHHFRSKSAVMKELLDIAVTPARARAAELAGAGGPAAERLARYLLDTSAVAVRSRFDLVGLVDDDVLTEPEFEDWRGIVADLRGDLRGIVAQGIAAGELIDVNAADAQVAVEGLLAARLRVLRARSGRDVDDVDARVGDAVLLAVRMLLRDAGRAESVLAAARALP